MMPGLTLTAGWVKVMDVSTERRGIQTKDNKIYNF